MSLQCIFIEATFLYKKSKGFFSNITFINTLFNKVIILCAGGGDVDLPATASFSIGLIGYCLLI